MRSNGRVSHWVEHDIGWLCFCLLPFAFHHLISKSQTILLTISWILLTYLVVALFNIFCSCSQYFFIKYYYHYQIQGMVLYWCLSSITLWQLWTLVTQKYSQVDHRIISIICSSPRGLHPSSLYSFILRFTLWFVSCIYLRISMAW